MTERYKYELYAERESQVAYEQDLAALAKGTTLRKLNAATLRLREHFYRIDIFNNTLLASTREFKMDKKAYYLISLSDVKLGCAPSEHLTAYKRKLAGVDKQKAAQLDTLAFVVYYENFNKSLHMLAASQTDRDRWCRVIDYLIFARKRNKGVLPAANKLMPVYFEHVDELDAQLATSAASKKLRSRRDLVAIFKELNVRIRKDKLKQMMASLGIDPHQRRINQLDFKRLVQSVYRRLDLISLFKMIKGLTSEMEADTIPEWISATDLANFHVLYQSEESSGADCERIIERYEADESNRQLKRLSLVGFVDYMTSDDEQLLANPAHDRVYQDMERPFCCYFINSSHNTYLVGDQLTSMSKPEGFMAAIMKGARLVEMDVYDGHDGMPKIYHSNTLTSKITFEEALVAIKEYAFKLSDYPLIITIELRCSTPQQKTMAFLIKKHISELIYTDEYDATNNSYPTLNQLKRKIILRCRRPQPKTIDALARGSFVGGQKRASTTTTTLTTPTRDRAESSFVDCLPRQNADTEKENELGELFEFVNILQNATFRGIEYAMANYSINQTSSISETKAKKLIDSHEPRHTILYNATFLTKVYPAFYRQDSSNLKPIDYWMNGFQIAALNFQNMDTQMQLNAAMFSDNGSCGYVLKPRILLDAGLNFNPNETRTMRNKRRLDIRLISGQRLPRSSSNSSSSQNRKSSSKDISDPYVRVSVCGVPADVADKRTKTVRDNGFNPLWNETLSFVVNCPELAFVKFEVMDDDFGKDSLIGHYTIRFESMRAGYRHIRLINKTSTGSLFVAVRTSPYQSLI